jgi:hypothetical protein
MTIRSLRVSFLSAACVGLSLACSSGNHTAPPPEHTGQTCTAASQCYPTLDAAALHGTVTCLTQLTNGYCTHTCQTDADCCAVPGECLTGYKQVCASFESSGQMYCFLSCNTADIAAAPDAGTMDPATYCQRFANPTFTCRSTGGGVANQKFCGP